MTPPITILKPLKGAEPGLEDSLATFFEQDYPNFELIFCVAHAEDPSVAIVERLLKRYSGATARLNIGAAEVGPNPKVNNLLPGYDSAKNDLLLISDSNVRVWPTYLRRLAATMEPGVGVVTAVIAGRHGKGLGGRLEGTYLNTFFARGMPVAFALGLPLVIGKTMLFRRSVMERFGGLRNLANYVAEDFMTGEAMRKLGYKIALLHEPVAQYIGKYSVSEFWFRHVRWGRIRRSQFAPGFYSEPVTYSFVSAFLGAVGWGLLFHVFPWGFLLLHFTTWALCDATMLRIMERRYGLDSFLIWMVRETIAIPHWFHMFAGHTILWRGHSLKLERGGLVRV